MFLGTVPPQNGPISIEHTFDDSKNDFKQWTKDIFEHLGTLRKGVYNSQLIGDKICAWCKNRQNKPPPKGASVNKSG